MIVAGIIGVLGGLLLGGRFKVFAVVAAQGAALAAVAVLVVSGRCAAWDAGLDLGAFTLCLQAGYLVMLLAGTRATESLGVLPRRA